MCAESMGRLGSDLRFSPVLMGVCSGRYRFRELSRLAESGTTVFLPTIVASGGFEGCCVSEELSAGSSRTRFRSHAR